MKTILLLAVLATAALAEITSYEGYKVYQVTPSTERQANLLKLFKKSDQFDFWSEVRALNHPATIMVAPKMQKAFVRVLESNKISYNVINENLETSFEAERQQQARAPKVEKGRISFTEYQRYDTIQAYLNQLAVDYPDLVTVETFATSYEGRSVDLIRIGNNPNNPNIVIDGGIHAREWIAPATVLYIIQQLVENSEYRYMSENVNWIIVPVLNPDGYEYTHTNTRLWRKTRSRGVSCYGADGNRNFDFHWGGLGTSSNECSEIFTGSSPFSEPEVRGFADVALGLDNIVLYLAIHSYGQWLLYPWGFEQSVPDNNAELSSLGNAVADAIRSVSGTSYTVGNSAILLYEAAGASDDWMMAIGGAPLSYTVELPGGGNNGFDLPPNRITAVVAETWQGMLVYYNYVSNNLKAQN